MAIVSAFMPSGSTVLVGASATQVPTTSGIGASSFRIRNMSASVQYFAWGTASSVAAPVAPTAGVPSASTIGMLGNSVETFILPPNAWFIAGTVTGFEFTPGEGI